MTHHVPWTEDRVTRRVEDFHADRYTATIPRRAGLDSANIVTSESASERHAHCPVIDLDFPCVLVGSSTPGHFHLYMERRISWRAYRKVLKAMSDAGLVERGYYRASLARGFTAARLPWIKK